MLERPRRNRISPAIRSMVRETELSPAHLIYPLFVIDGKGKKEAIPSLPDLYRFTEDELLRELNSAISEGIDKVVLFPAVDDSLKNATATYSWAEDNFYLRIIRRCKEEFPHLCIMSDVAMDPYSSDGHDGLVKDGQILNDETLPILDRMALAQAQAGVDIIGPSDMMDGRVASIRMALDDAGYANTSIMSYTAKYASAYYGPFRDALDSAPKSGDKKTYQMDPANSREALREASLDEAEGADMLMVKPALCYLDVIKMLDEHSDLPVAAYNVSGEYAMLKAAAMNGWLDFEPAMAEMLLSIRRAGASAILSYFARDYARFYNKSK